MPTPRILSILEALFHREIRRDSSLTVQCGARTGPAPEMMRFAAVGGEPGRLAGSSGGKAGAAASVPPCLRSSTFLAQWGDSGFSGVEDFQAAFRIQMGAAAQLEHEARFAPGNGGSCQGELAAPLSPFRIPFLARNQRIATREIRYRLSQIRAREMVEPETGKLYKSSAV